MDLGFPSPFFYICDFYDELKKWNSQNNGLLKEIASSFIHETFVYLIAVLFKNKNYSYM